MDLFFPYTLKGITAAERILRAEHALQELWFLRHETFLHCHIESTALEEKKKKTVVPTLHVMEEMLF